VAAAEVAAGAGSVPIYDNNWVYDGRFVFCRLAFRQAPDGDGGGWSVDYPRADMNFPFRLGELTETSISRDSRGEPNHVVLTAMDPHLFECPFVMMTEPGGAYFDEAEAANLGSTSRRAASSGPTTSGASTPGRHGNGSFARRSSRSSIPIEDIAIDHPLLHMLYYMDSLPQIPSLNHWQAAAIRRQSGEQTAPCLTCAASRTRTAM
jgi:hypothetical protein